MRNVLAEMSLQAAYLSFLDKERNVHLQPGGLKCFCKKAKLFCPDFVIDVKDDTFPKSRDIEFVHLCGGESFNTGCT